jgi:hypothetical protein
MTMNNGTPSAFYAPARTGVSRSQMVAGYNGVATTITKNTPKNKAAACSADICQHDEMAEMLSCKINLEHRNSMHNKTDYSKYVRAAGAGFAMNVTPEVAQKALDIFKATPLIFAVVVINIIALLGFAFVLNEVSNAMERREGLIKACIDRST